MISGREGGRVGPHPGVLHVFSVFVFVSLNNYMNKDYIFIPIYFSNLETKASDIMGKATAEEFGTLLGCPIYYKER